MIVAKLQTLGLLLFLVGTFIVLKPEPCHAQHSSLDMAAEEAAARELAQQQIYSKIFPAITCGPGRSTSVYTFSNEIEVVVSSEHYASIKQVDLEIERKLKGTTGVGQRGIRLDEDGEWLGHRAIVSLPVVRDTKKDSDSPSQANVIYLLIWTEGTWLISVKSSSLRYVLAYEITQNAPSDNSLNPTPR